MYLYKHDPVNSVQYYLYPENVENISVFLIDLSEVLLLFFSENGSIYISMAKCHCKTYQVKLCESHHARIQCTKKLYENVAT